MDEKKIMNTEGRYGRRLKEFIIKLLDIELSYNNNVKRTSYPNVLSLSYYTHVRHSKFISVHQFQ